VSSEQNEGGQEATSARIRTAALRCFAARGVEVTSLREVAAEAGVSIGAVQYNFGAKSQLVSAVDAYSLDVIRRVMAGEPPTVQGAESIDVTGQRVATLMSEYPEVAEYVARSIVDATAFGSSIFDILVDLGTARWRRRAEQGLLDVDTDQEWAVLNSILITVAAIVCRPQLDAHLPKPFTSAAMLSRWTRSVNAMIRGGFTPPPDDHAGPDDPG
jgi:AcrR family transcriptional regulator